MRIATIGEIRVSDLGLGGLGQVRIDRTKRKATAFRFNCLLVGLVGLHCPQQATTTTSIALFGIRLSDPRAGLDSD